MIKHMLKFYFIEKHSVRRPGIPLEKKVARKLPLTLAVG